MIHITKEENCCGCGACAAVCPKKCIQMVPGTLGAVFPRVDTECCIACGACDRVCPILNPEQRQEGPEQRAYAAFARQEDIRFRGSSGGVFGVLARNVIAEGGIVYGAAFDKNLKLRCSCAETLAELAPLYKSKYLQSDLKEKYAEIKKQLQNGRTVLFVSTPCQNAALQNYLNRQYENLLTVDFFCHGVPSQKFFDECIAYEDEEKKRKTLSYEFRTKKNGGVTPHYYTKKLLKNGREIKKTGYYFESPFYAAFQQYVSLRESCYTCQFSSRNRVTDLTIGDFHDIDRYISGINRFDGVSTLIVNTENGRKYYERIRDQLQVYDMDLNKLIADGTVFAGCTKRPDHRDAFASCYETKGISGLMTAYLSQKRYLKNRIYYSLPGFLRKLVKKGM